MAVSEVLLPPEEQDRADLYAWIAALLLAPDPSVVRALAALPRHAEPEGALPTAWNALLAAAARCGPAVREEFDALFAAGDPPRLHPCQGCYLAGWRRDEPLAQLRDDLRALRLVRTDGVPAPEDHLGALCEAMRLLIQRGEPLAVQRRFFGKHLAGWSTQCLQDIAHSPGADFYRALAHVTLAFFALEAEAFALDEPATVAAADAVPSP